MLQYTNLPYHLSCNVIQIHFFRSAVRRTLFLVEQCHFPPSKTYCFCNTVYWWYSSKTLVDSSETGCVVSLWILLSKRSSKLRRLRLQTLHQQLCWLIFPLPGRLKQKKQLFQTSSLKNINNNLLVLCKLHYDRHYTGSPRLDNELDKHLYIYTNFIARNNYIINFGTCASNSVPSEMFVAGTVIRVVNYCTISIWRTYRTNIWWNSTFYKDFVFTVTA